MLGKEKKGFFDRFRHKTTEEPAHKTENTPSVNTEQTAHTSDPVNPPEPPPAAPEKKSSVFVGGGNIWSDLTDPLYVRVDEEALESECRSFIRDMEQSEFSSSARKKLEWEISDLQNQLNDPRLQEFPPEHAKSLQDRLTSLQKPVDAQIGIKLSKNHMIAWAYITPPFNGGKDINVDALKAALKAENVTTGIMDEALTSIIQDNLCYIPVLVAKGSPAKNGVDGSITDYFKRELKQEFAEDERGSVDFKNLNLIQSIHEGEVICDITSPIPGVPGITVKGASVPIPHDGKAAPIPMGRNTILSEGNISLISQKDGHITFQHDKFNVDSMLRVPGDVDGTVGNIDYNGDVVIEGDVRSGFFVKATGNIQIKGSVEGAKLEAGADIRIANGVLGNNVGEIRCEGDLFCRYLEHCRVSVKGDIHADSIVRSNIQCEQSVIVTTGMGVIISGVVLAIQSIEAKSIGSKAQQITELILGTPPQSIDEEKQTERELKQLRHNLSELDKNITFLTETNKPEKQELLERLKDAYSTLAPKENELVEKLEHLRNPGYDLRACRITCTHLYPVTKIQIGVSNLIVKDEYSKCNIYLNSEGEVTIGTD